MFFVHPPEAEAIHDLSQGVILVEEFNRSHNIEDNLGILTHEESVNGAWDLNYVVAWRASPLVLMVAPLQLYQHMS